MRIFYFIPFLLLLLFSCNGDRDSFRSWSAGSVVKSPVQHKNTGIEMTEPEDFKNLGKIYYQPPFLFLNEEGKGLHIIDNTDPKSPEKVKFIKIPGNYDLAMKGRYLYVNHLRDMVLLRIDEDQVVELQRFQNAFSNSFLDYPKNYKGYFICPDPDKGKVIYWEDIIAESEPNCRI